MMKCVVGLGNPGSEYESTRHNVGFMVLDQLAAGKKWAKSKSNLLHYTWINYGSERLELIKPQTFMNRSGEAVSYVLKKHPESLNEGLYVVHDDLDIALGKFKIQFGKGPRLHGGVDSIESVLKTDRFWRVRIGVEGLDRQDTSKINKIPGKNYVLQSFSREEQLVIQDVITQVTKALIENIQS